MNGESVPFQYVHKNHNTKSNSYIFYSRCSYPVPTLTYSLSRIDNVFIAETMIERK